MLGFYVVFKLRCWYSLEEVWFLFCYVIWIVKVLEEFYFYVIVNIFICNRLGLIFYFVCCYEWIVLSWCRIELG